MNIQVLSNRYTIRDLLPRDAAMVYEVLKANTLFYKYHPPVVTIESILEDMEALPPNKGSLIAMTYSGCGNMMDTMSYSCRDIKIP